MTVAQLRQHVAEHLKHLEPAHIVVEAGGVAGMHLVPVETDGGLLIVEEAVVLVDDAPQRLEVARRGVGHFFLFYTRSGQCQRAADQDDGGKAMEEVSVDGCHGMMSVMVKCLTYPMRNEWV